MILMHKIGAQNLATLSVILCSTLEKKTDHENWRNYKLKRKKRKKMIIITERTL